MKTSIPYILCVSIFLLFQSCKTDDDKIGDPPPYVKDHYIQFFHSDLRDDDMIVQNSLTNLTVDEEQKTIHIAQSDKDSKRGNYITVKPMFKNVYSGGSTSGVTNRYLEFAALINDFHYPLTRYQSWMYDFPTAIVDTLQSVKVFTDQDYTSEFLAGSDVSSLFSIYFEDPLRTIQNDYKSVTGEDAYQDKRFQSNDYWKVFPHTITGNILSTIDFSKKYFIGSEWLLTPHQKPDVSGEYVFTIEIATRSGKVVTKKTTPFQIDK